ncbi:hypothetical protein Pta6605_54550 [Pseudomonas amygdali pv. tabaci]|nr:hypothetical protein Pta6605_54550 [Pseudomonas amygdali pv. tabaci]
MTDVLSIYPYFASYPVQQKGKTIHMTHTHQGLENEHVRPGKSKTAETYPPGKEG